MADVQVETELKLDSNAEQVMNAIESGFEDLEEQIDDSQSILKDFGVQFAAVFSAISVTPLLEQVAEVTTSFISLGSEAYDLEQNIAGMLSGMTGAEWGIARAYAEDLNDKFNELAISIGQSKEDIATGHSALVTFLGGTSKAFDVASRNMENLTVIANVQGRTVQELGNEFGKMASGSVSMESAVFNLLRPTGIFADDITKVTQEWQKLTEEERVARLEGAFDSVAKNLKDAPPTMSDMVNSMSAIGDEFMETFGKSAMQEFMGEMENVRGDLIDLRSDMGAFSADVGKDIGKFAARAFEVIREGIGFIREHSDEIRDSVKEGFQFAKNTVEWIIDHKGELMAIGGALALSRTGAGSAIIGGAVGMAARTAGAAGAAMGGLEVTRATGGLTRGGQLMKQAEAMTTMGRFSSSMNNFVRAGGPAVQMGGRLASSVGSFASAIAAGGPPVWAATAGVTAFAGGLIYLNNKIEEAEQERQRTIDEGMQEYEQLLMKRGRLNEEEKKRLDELNIAIQEAAADKLIPERMFEKLEGLEEKRDELRDAYINPLEEARDRVERMADEVDHATKVLEARTSLFGAESEEASAAEQEYMEGLLSQAAKEEEIAQKYVNAFKRSWSEHDKATMEYIIRLIGNSEDLREAFFESADMASEGFSKMITVAKQMEESEGINKLIGLLKRRQIQEKEELEEAAKGAGRQINFNGGQVFKIQQNFREQDPDRVVVAFEKRFTQAAISRVQATTTTPFGT